MAAIHLVGRVTESGALEVELRTGVEPGLVHVTIEHIDPEQAWFWTPEWQAKEIKADEDFAAGRYKDFYTMQELLADLFGDDYDQS